MKLKHGSKIYEATASLKNGEINASIDGEKILLRGGKISDNSFSVSDGENFSKIYVAEDKNKIYVFAEDASYVFEKISEDESTLAGEDGTNANKEEIKPPMPGSIVKILVEKGQKVKEGEGLIVVEAMKMETTLYASITGEVKEINVAEGEQVDSDKILVVIEK